MVSKSRNIGKWFEAKTEDALRNLKSKKVCTYVRLHDSYAAQGNLLPGQPGDFIVKAKGSPCLLLECKSSEKYKTLRSCLSSHVEPHQAAAHRIWHMMEGATLFVFYSDVIAGVEFWNGNYVGECRGKGQQLDKGGALDVVPLLKLEQTLKTFLLDEY